MRAVLAKVCDKAVEVSAGNKGEGTTCQGGELDSQPASFLMTGTDGASGNIQFQLLFTPEWPQAAASGIAPTQSAQP